MRGALTKIGDTFDRLTGRRWIPSSSLATSGLIDRLKLLMDGEARLVPGKGTVVPHNIKLKMQWDKFSTDADDAMTRLENELLAAAADHINDSLYYTYAPLKIEVKRDYFTEGVKLFVGYDTFVEGDKEAELNVTVTGIALPKQVLLDESVSPPAADVIFAARFRLDGTATEKRLVFPLGGRLSVGRSGVSALALDDVSVSKIHASLAINPAGILCVADTGSTNGTFINNERISYGMALEIADGDVVKFGLIEVEFAAVPRQEATDQTDEVDESSFYAAMPGDTSGVTDAGRPVANDTIEVPQPSTTAAGTDRDSATPTDGEADVEFATSGEANQ